MFITAKSQVLSEPAAAPEEAKVYFKTKGRYFRTRLQCVTQFRPCNVYSPEATLRGCKRLPYREKDFHRSAFSHLTLDSDMAFMCRHNLLHDHHP